ncbi:MAG TPA: RNA methyltransferase [Chitinophagaceae bacterium]|jgi:TrmH family RNA methyltransferase|nr:RNA methyltransferase [Chitinophagaceae bacterium]
MLVKQKIKYIQSLGQKKFRGEEGLFIAEGPKLVKELLEASPAEIKEIYAVKDWIDDNKGLVKNISTIEVTVSELQRISQLTTANQALAVVQQYEIIVPVTVSDRITLALDTIQDPGNMGTIIRIADWFGISQIVCSHDSADIYNPKVVQSTMGSIARVKVHYADLDEWLGSQKDIRIYAASLEGEDIALVKKIKEGIIVIGNESKGISHSIMNLANVKITIPKKGKAESLNAAIATGIMLSHIC